MATNKTLRQRLPFEIILRVLEQIDASQRPTCAAVCKFWQGFVERSTFNTLALQPTDLDYFVKLILADSRRRNVLKHVTFCIPFECSLPYSRHSRGKSGNYERSKQNNEDFREAIFQLFTTLSLFNNTESTFTLGLVTSGYDIPRYRTWIQRYGLTNWQKSSLHAKQKFNDESAPRVVFHKHRNAHGPVVALKDPASFNSMDWGSFAMTENGRGPIYNTLPVVRAVTELQVSCQHFPYIGDISRSMMMRSLPSLKRVAFEKRHEDWPTDFRSLLIGLNGFGAMLPNWPQSLKSIYMYEFPSDMDSDEDVDFNIDRSAPANLETATALGWHSNSLDLLDFPMDWRVTMGHLRREIIPKHVALRSQGMEELGLCNFIDGRRFFDAFDDTTPLPVWPELRVLSLTASLLPKGLDELGDAVVHEDPESVSKLLRRVAEFVRQMPKLQVLEIHEVNDLDAALFRFSALNNRYTAQWISTWPDPMIDDGAKAVWESLPMDGGHSHVEFLPDKLMVICQGPMDFISTHLLTSSKILDPVTLGDELRVEEMDWVNFERQR